MSTIVVVFFAVVLLVVMIAIMLACFIFRLCAPLDLLLRSVRWLYLLRVPLLTALGIAGLCLAVRLGGARSLLGGVFDIGTKLSGAFFVSLTAFLTAWVVMASWRLVRLYGPTRMFEHPAPPIMFRPADRKDEIFYLALYYLLVLLVAFPVVWLTLTTSDASAAQWIMAFLGFLTSLLCIGIVAFSQLFLNRSWGVDSVTPDLFLPTRLLRFNRIVDRLRSNDDRESEGRGDSRRFGQLPEDMFRGYLHYEGTARNRRATYILPGHVAAGALLMVTVVAYVTLGAIKFLTFGDDSMIRPESDVPFFPALCYILLLAALFCWAFSSVAFFLDRYRVLVLVPLALLLAVTSTLPLSEYRFPVQKKVQPSSYEEVAQTTDEPTARGDGAQDGSKDDSIIVVAVNGGGIQAAAWGRRCLRASKRHAAKSRAASNSTRRSALSALCPGAASGPCTLSTSTQMGTLPREQTMRTQNFTASSTGPKGRA